MDAEEIIREGLKDYQKNRKRFENYGNREIELLHLPFKMRIWKTKLP